MLRLPLPLPLPLTLSLTVHPDAVRYVDQHGITKAHKALQGHTGGISGMTSVQAFRRHHGRLSGGSRSFTDAAAGGTHKTDKTLLRTTHCRDALCVGKTFAEQLRQKGTTL